MTCACPACCMAAWSARPTPAFDTGHSSAPACSRSTRLDRGRPGRACRGGPRRLRRRRRGARGAGDPGAERLAVRWRAATACRTSNAPEAAVRANPGTPRILLDRGDRRPALAGAAGPARADLHLAVPDACLDRAVLRGRGLARGRADRLVRHAEPALLRADLARLPGQARARHRVERLEAAGCYGRNCADDVSGRRRSAVARGRAPGARAADPRAGACLGAEGRRPGDATSAGGLDAAGRRGYDFETRYPSNRAPTLALLLTGKVPPDPVASQMGDRTAIPPYAYDDARITVHDMAPIARASWLRGVSALPNTFRARVASSTNCAIAAGVDPVEYRLRYLPDQRAAALVRDRAERAGWVPPRAPRHRSAATATSCSGAASPMRSTCTARFRASAPPGRPGWRMSR